jgi:hypothetical protein
MTTRVLLLTAAVAALIIGIWFAAAALGRPTSLRSRHSDPGIVAPAALVAVTADGKLYHDPKCPFIHGPVRTESSAEAIAEGYTPCVRCLKR